MFDEIAHAEEEETKTVPLGQLQGIGPSQGDDTKPQLYPFDPKKRYYMFEFGLAGWEAFTKYVRFDFFADVHRENVTAYWVFAHDGKLPLEPNHVVRSLKQAQDGSWAIESFKHVPLDTRMILPKFCD